MKTVDDIMKENTKSQSQLMRAVIWKIWEHQNENGLTQLSSEAFYKQRTEKIIQELRSELPETRYNPEDYNV